MHTFLCKGENMNLELQKKIDDAIKETFVGNYIFSEEEQTEMLEELSRAFRYVCNSWGASFNYSQYELAFVTLVNLTKKWDSHEDTWLEFLYKKLLGRQSLEDAPTGKAYKIIQEVYESLTRRNKIFYFDSFTKKYYACITSHAMAPTSSFFSLFDLCWKIYCEDLNQEYVENDSAFYLIAQSLKNKFAGKIKEEEDLKIGSDAYALKASIKGLIIDRPEIFISLLKDIICSINSLFNSKPLIKDTYLHSLISEWWIKKEKTFGSRLIRTLNREKIVTDYSQIRAKYIIDNGEIKLYTPSFRLISDLDYEPYIEIKVNEKIVLTKEMETVGSGILMKTKSFEVALDDLPISNSIRIAVTITHNAKIIYSSQETLYRDFILLNDRKELVSQDCIPDNYYLYITNFNDLMRYPEDIQRISGKLFSLIAIDGEVLQSKHRTVYFTTEKTNRDLYFHACERGDIVFQQNGEDYTIIDGDLFVDMIASLDAKGYGVRFQEAQFKLIDFDSENLDGYTRFNISILLDVGNPQKITVFRYKDNSVVASHNIVKFNNISVNFDKPYYYDNNLSGAVRFKTEKYDVLKQFEASEEEVFVPVENGEVVIKPPTIRWKIDEGSWKCMPTDTPVWYKKHNNASILKVQVPKNMNCTIGLSNHCLTVGEKYSEYDLGRLLYSLKETDSQDEFPLFINTGTEMLLLETIVTKEKFIGEAITVNSEEKEIYWNPEYFIGDESSVFEIRFYKENRLLSSVACDNSKKITYSLPFDDGYYEIEVVYLPKGFVKKEIPCLRKKCILGNEKVFRFQNKRILLRKVVLFDCASEETIRPLYICKLRYLGEYEKSDIYSGELFFLNHNTGFRTPVKFLADSEGQTVQINPLRIELRTNLTCYIGYGLAEMDKEFDYDNEFTLDATGKISVSMRTKGRKNRNIDYYIMEVEKDV